MPVEQAQKQLDEILGQITSAKAKHNDILRATNTDEHQKAKLEAEVVLLDKKVEEGQLKYIKIADKIAIAENDLRKTEDDIKSLKLELSLVSDSLRDAKKSADAEIKVISFDLANKKSEINKLIQTAELRVQEITSDIASYENQKLSLESDIASLAETKKRLLNDVDFLSKKRDDLDGDVDTLTHQKSSLEMTLRSITSENVSLESKNKILAGDISSNNTLLGEVQVKVKEAQAQLLIVNDEIKTKQGEIIAANAKVLSLLDREEYLKRKELTLKAKYERAGLKYED